MITTLPHIVSSAQPNDVLAYEAIMNETTQEDWFNIPELSNKYISSSLPLEIDIDMRWIDPPINDNMLFGANADDRQRRIYIGVDPDGKYRMTSTSTTLNADVSLDFNYNTIKIYYMNRNMRMFYNGAEILSGRSLVSLNVIEHFTIGRLSYGTPFMCKKAFTAIRVFYANEMICNYKPQSNGKILNEVNGTEVFNRNTIGQYLDVQTVNFAPDVPLYDENGALYDNLGNTLTERL